MGESEYAGAKFSHRVFFWKVCFGEMICHKGATKQSFLIWLNVLSNFDWKKRMSSELPSVLAGDVKVKEGKRL